MGVQSITLATFKNPTGGGGAALLIDDVGASASFAYGLRKLRTAYAGACIRVRRASDDAEQDIGFSGESLDWADAISFKGASTIFVDTWYDQSGNGYDLTQGTTSAQPQLDTSGEEIDFDGAGDFLSVASVNLSATDVVSAFHVGKTSSTSTQVIWEHGNNTGKNIVFFINGSQTAFMSIDATNNFDTLANWADGNYQLLSTIIDRGESGGDVVKSWRNSTNAGSNGGTTGVTGNFDTLTLYVGTRGTPEYPYNGSMKELVLFPSDLTASRATAEGNINTYHSIY
jgi:hypothetical protein